MKKLLIVGLAMIGLLGSVQVMACKCKKGCDVKIKNVKCTCKNEDCANKA